MINMALQQLGKIRTCDVWGGTVYGLEDGRILWTKVRIIDVHRRQLATHPANIARGGKPQATNKPCTHIGKDVTIQVGHNHHAI